MKIIQYLFISTIFLAACSETDQPKDNEDKQEEVNVASSSSEGKKEQSDLGPIVIENNGFTIREASIEKSFPEAELKLIQPKSIDKAGEVQFDFQVSNYELAEQTEGDRSMHCANSEKGQHIHFILNNAPYEAHYEPSFKAELSVGNNVVLAFLSRSYHESIKNKTAFVLKNFPLEVTNDGFDLKAPHLFYSRPKGSYQLAKSDKILLDFYLVNTTLSENGNRVEVNLNNEKFMLSKWEPFFIEGLGKGEHSIRIRLLDAEGKIVPGPFNDSGERSFTIK